MIVVDTSALLEILFAQSMSGRCESALSAQARVFISAGTLAETLIVATTRRRGPEIRRLIEGFGFEVVPVTAETAESAAEAYRQWGKGQHPAGLNLGDCFAYVLAREMNCPLLFVGNDFSRTDIASAL